MAILATIVVAYVWVILFWGYVADATIGINWGRQSTTKMIPSQVVDLLMQNKVPAVKLYNSDDDLLKAFAGSRIEVTIAISNLNDVRDYNSACAFVQRKIKAFPTVNIKYVLVGNNAFTVARAQNNGNFDKVLQALNDVQLALQRCGSGSDVKAIISHSFTGVLTLNGSRPSDARFTDDLNVGVMPRYLRFLKDNNAPFVFDVFPIALVSAFQLDPNFGFFDNKSTFVVTDINGFRYDNIFDYIYDSFVWAIKKAGFDGIKISVGQIGWPTDGYQGADVESAERFWKGLLPKVTSNRGTPMLPGAPIDIYIHSLTDEKMNSASLPFTRHWGIYRSNGEPKYKIDLTGQGRDIFPTSAKGLNLMPGRWCIFNGSLFEALKVREQYDYACRNADCTSLGSGGSCSMLSYPEKISYAFNAYFQNNFQVESACQFQGLGKVVVQNPSKDGCVFSVEVVKGIIGRSNGGKLLVHKHMLLVFLVFILSMLG